MIRRGAVGELERFFVEILSKPWIFSIKDGSSRAYLRGRGRHASSSGLRYSEGNLGGYATKVGYTTLPGIIAKNQPSAKASAGLCRMHGNCGSSWSRLPEPP